MFPVAQRRADLNLTAADSEKSVTGSSLLVKNPLYQDWIKSANDRDSTLAERQRAWSAREKARLASASERHSCSARASAASSTNTPRRSYRFREWLNRTTTARNVEYRLARRVSAVSPRGKNTR